METILSYFCFFRGLSSGLFPCSAFGMVSRACLARSPSLLSREDARFCTSLSRYLSFDLCIWQPTSPFSVPSTAASELLPITKHPRSGESPRAVTHHSPCSATSWTVPDFSGGAGHTLQVPNQLWLLLEPRAAGGLAPLHPQAHGAWSKLYKTQACRVQHT